MSDEGRNLQSDCRKNNRLKMAASQQLRIYISVFSEFKNGLASNCARSNSAALPLFNVCIHK
jgi:hypothetical protein